MKKCITIILAIAFTLSLAACNGKQTEFDIKIVVPAGTTEGMVYSHEEISPMKDVLTISAGKGLGDTEVKLKTIEVKEENTYESAYITPGMPVKMDVERGAWFKIGVNVQNTTEEDIVVYVHVEDVEVRISSEETEETDDRSSEEIDISTGIQDEEIEEWDRKPMVMVDGILYLDTGCESKIEARCGMMDGEITSTVDRTEIPTENNQSNFGTGYGYQYGTEGTIEIFMNDKWWVYATDELCGYPTIEDMEEAQDGWGIRLSAENVTPTGMTLVISQSGGEPTGKLQFGSEFMLKVWNDGKWEELPYFAEVAWSEEAYNILMEDSTKQAIAWEFLYGSLSSGKYQLSKHFMDFRSTEDYDIETYTVEFEIE